MYVCAFSCVSVWGDEMWCQLQKEGSLTTGSVTAYFLLVYANRKPQKNWHSPFQTFATSYSVNGRVYISFHSREILISLKNRTSYWTWCDERILKFTHSVISVHAYQSLVVGVDIIYIVCSRVLCEKQCVPIEWILWKMWAHSSFTRCNFLYSPHPHEILIMSPCFFLAP